MPGPPTSPDGWGASALLVDTSAWARANDPLVVADWKAALLADRLRISPAIRLEILLSARRGVAFDDLAEELSALRQTALTPAILRAAEEAMPILAHRSYGAHRIPIVDYLVAATAQEAALTVLHYDHDYDTLAEVLEFEARWLAPRGTLA